jgi:hypothetical protein
MKNFSLALYQPERNLTSIRMKNFFGDGCCHFLACAYMISPRATMRAALIAARNETSPLLCDGREDVAGISGGAQRNQVALLVGTFEYEPTFLRRVNGKRAKRKCDLRLDP